MTDWSVVYGPNCSASVPSRIDHVTMSVVLQDQSHMRVLSAACAADQVAPGPPTSTTTTTIAVSMPPTSTKVCSTSVQMTAAMPPSTV